jgi:Zn-dependent M28 family amino/carboxypeptidase
MNILSIVKDLEGKSNMDRLKIIMRYLDKNKIPYDLHYYATGTNVIVGSINHSFIGIGSHFDVVKDSPGANDNASSVAVALVVLERVRKENFKGVNLVFYFFDEEEKGRIGSKTYIKDNGVFNMKGFLNLEMVGMGDRIALWSLNADSKGKILDTIETVAKEKNIFCGRFDKIVGRYADHVSFINAGVKDSFSITAISKEDLDVSIHYNKAIEFDVDKEVLDDILAGAPLFKHYHKPTDLSKYLSEDSLNLVADLVYQTICRLSI